MKKVSSILIALIATIGMVSMGFAQTTATVSATATVQSELRLTASVFRVDSTPDPDKWDTTPTTTMAFGTLTHTLDDGSEAGLLFSKPYYYVALLGGFTSGRRYRIQSTCFGLVGPTTITKGFGVTFIDGDPKKADGSPINTGSITGTLGTPGTAVATNKVLYDSGSAAQSRVIAAYYGIPPYKAGADPAPFPGHEKIPVDTPAGNYSGNVVFSLVLY